MTTTEPEPGARMQPSEAAPLPTPQGLGAFPFPAGLLLVPGGEGHDTVARALATGRRPHSWPASLEPLRLAHAGQVEEALAAMAELPGGVWAYNAWVLDPELAPWDQVRADLPAGYEVLADLVAWMAGLVDTLPETWADPLAGAGVAAELAPLVHATLSAARLDHHDLDGAGRHLQRAVGAAQAQDLAPLAATMQVALASHLVEHHPTAEQLETARALLREAEATLRDSDLEVTRAEVLLQLGSIDHEQAAAGHGDARTLLHQAVRHYYDGLQLVSEQSDPVLWARLQLNLATAHLAIPMSTASDQLRLGVAAQALRSVRRVLTVDEHPGPWSTATINLANALVYTPSTHQGDNLVEAVELYEEVLASGVRDDDPLGRARLLANQGNTLAHLGIFDQARSRLVEARFLFEEHLDHEGALVVRGVLDEIVKSGLEASGAGTGTQRQSDDELARQAEQMSRMPVPETYTSGMGVQVVGIDTVPPPKPRVTVLPTRRPDEPGGAS